MSSTSDQLNVIQRQIQNIDLRIDSLEDDLIGFEENILISKEEIYKDNKMLKQRLESSIIRIQKLEESQKKNEAQRLQDEEERKKRDEAQRLREEELRETFNKIRAMMDQ